MLPASSSSHQQSYIYALRFRSAVPPLPLTSSAQASLSERESQLSSLRASEAELGQLLEAGRAAAEQVGLREFRSQPRSAGTSCERQDEVAV